MGRRGFSSGIIVAFLLGIMALGLVAATSVRTYGQNQVDVSRSVSIVDSGLVYNPTTGTFDSTLTITNISTESLFPPLSLVLTNTTPSPAEGPIYLDLPTQSAIPPGGSINFTYQVKVLAADGKPVANPGSDQTAYVYDVVYLDGSKSYDPNGFPITYNWSFSSMPAGSLATLSDPYTASPSFIPDLSGDYVVRLIVNDGTLNSTPSTVYIKAVSWAPPYVMTTANPTNLGNGITQYDVTSIYNDSTTHLRVVTPSGPVRKVIYLLPVKAGDTDGAYGNAIPALQSINAANSLGAVLLEPTFAYDPWYGDHVSDTTVRYDSFMSDLQNWARAQFPTATQHILFGYSKAGFGALSLITRHPDQFDLAVCQDFPNPTAVSYSTVGGNFGTALQGGDVNYAANYQLTQAHLAARATPFKSLTRLWIGRGSNFAADGTGYEGVPTIEGRLTAAGMLHSYSTNGLTHFWYSGWAQLGLNALLGTTLSTAKTTQAAVAYDDFSGTLGNWSAATGNNLGVITGGALGPPAAAPAGLMYWSGTGSFANDQWVSAKLKFGNDCIAVQIQPAAAKCYFLKVSNSTTAAVISMTGPSTWSTLYMISGTFANGDVMTLHFQSPPYGQSTGIIRVYQNGNLIYTGKPASPLSGGVPGIWTYPGAPTLDDWSAGNLTF